MLYFFAKEAVSVFCLLLDILLYISKGDSVSKLSRLLVLAGTKSTAVHIPRFSIQLTVY
jgi:hypothetical protein